MDAMEQTGHAIQAALGHFKASTGADVDPVAFAKSLASGCPTPQTEFALEAHLREADPAELANLVIEGAASFHSLKTLADQLLPADHPNHAYIARFLP
ncbi:hypothetical protein GOFOIKOB_4006 [Methylobacterium tardum]|uniref:Uncharacterized protein n=1 Tax=Methylobacterium tardum TaxID=374432 RepID=A0AA37WR36_9HYPH|nr:hypothetical protein [Methylobacterium tardum]URD38170.1 hypothetical protein M6G65_06815 [Methylobacterium tardum]GJE50952.1 hypothetical protein GOFOIKOB_4006 [Methylobacterium tardum]GLS69956.1 hypothetical protein GCM10007890_19690 [Methylobacterium tardum]